MIPIKWFPLPTKKTGENEAGLYRFIPTTFPGSVFVATCHPKSSSINQTCHRDPRFLLSPAVFFPSVGFFQHHHILPKVQNSEPIPELAKKNQLPELFGGRYPKNYPRYQVLRIHLKIPRFTGLCTSQVVQHFLPFKKTKVSWSFGRWFPETHFTLILHINSFSKPMARNKTPMRNLGKWNHKFNGRMKS